MLCNIYVTQKCNAFLRTSILFLTETFLMVGKCVVSKSKLSLEIGLMSAYIDVKLVDNSF